MSGTDAMRAAKIVMELIRDDALVIPDDGRCWSWEASAEGKIAAALASVREPWPDAVQRVWDELESRAGFDGLLDGLDTRLCSEIREALRVAIYGAKIPEPGAGEGA